MLITKFLLPLSFLMPIELITVIILVFIGVALIIVEVLFIPGTTVVGILGFLFAAGGIYLAYQNLGNQAGHLILGITAVVTIISVIISFKSGVWNKFALKGAINSRVNEGIKTGLSEGDIGKTTSALRPIGKAEFNEKIFEVTTLSAYLAADIKIKIIKIERNKIIVEPLKK